ncbi:MAG: L,D-transpeptidase [Candidatus Calescibacterium sp.]|nr:L,D-transpeptidase [Candidatus Calescibacterium sp.]MCX7734107.1 L,D-transpeptidase [bacterium]MDW8087849.1 L,D-transpeptidase [Candidatus Calescibacterium sp.]
MVIVISLERQKLYVIDGEKIVKEYQISSSRYGAGNEEGSFRTPKGIHRIYKKIGEGMPEDTIFVGRKPVSPEEAQNIEDKISTRIIWLEGCEDGINKGKNEKGVVVDTKERFIYIHGTPDDINEPRSKGCIRMSKKDILELFDIVKEGEIVIIL